MTGWEFSMPRHLLTLLFTFSLLTGSCAIIRTSTYAPKQTIDDSIERNSAPTLIVITLLSRPCADGLEPPPAPEITDDNGADTVQAPMNRYGNQRNRRNSITCDEYAATDWYPIDVLLEDTHSRTMIGDQSKLKEIVALHRYAQMNFDSNMRKNVQLLRVSSISEYEHLKRTRSFLEYQISDFKNVPHWSSVVSLLTLFVFPGYANKQYELNVIAHKPGSEPKKTRITQPEYEMYFSWLFFLWGPIALGEPEEHFMRYTILSPASELQQSLRR
ncbi:MAG: hypothetical protein CVV45_16075 [Spirochaetae bacterium HGW-Spirochaetae-10]|nr:MAG: hypothetical protein CVV45_16075 [Spirochaetae bacterium HGW-Spirochaetae-10]